MQLELAGELLHELERVAAKREQRVETLIQTVLEDYIAKEQREAEFEDKIRTLMKDNEWLLNELAKR